MRTRSLITSLVLALPFALAGCTDTPSTPGVVTADVTDASDAPVSLDAPTADDARDEGPLADLVMPVDRPDVTVADVTPPPDVIADAPADLTADIPADVPMMVGPYPTGPYGNREGNVLANLSWEGYTNLEGRVISTTLPYGPTSMQAVRETGRRYGLVHVSEFF